MIINFEREKLANAIIYFVGKTKYCGVTKLFKLLYMLDFIHFRETARSVTGLQYVTWPKGPAPSELWYEIKGGLKADLVNSVRFDNPREDEGRYLVSIKPLRKFDGKFFSKRETRIMENLAFIFLEARAEAMVEATHLKGLPWDRTLKSKGLNAKIDYMLALDGVKGQLDEEELKHRIEEREELRKVLG